jgi:hypothetical protein
MIYYIYKIVCNDVSITDFYVGSTSNIRNRKCDHKSNCNNENSKKYNIKIYQTIRENGGWDNWRMVVLEEMEEGTTLLQSRMREEHYRLELQAKLNSICCGTGLTREEYIKEYRQTDKYKDYQKDYQKEYQQTDKYKEYQKEYQQTEKRKEYIKEYHLTDKYKEYHKEYQKEYDRKRQQTEKRKEYRRNLYQKNKEEINEKRRLKYLAKK